MRSSPWTPPALVALVAAATLACSGDEGPTAIEIPIDQIEILNASDCAFMDAFGDTCQIEVQAFSDDRPIGNPVLRWESSNEEVVTVSGGLLTSGIPGEATITVSNTTGTTRESMVVRVADSTK